MEYSITNNAGEQFKFFKDEQERTCLNIRVESELVACFILDDEDVEGLRKFLKE